MKHLYLFIWLLSIGIIDKTYGQTSPQLQWALSARNTNPNTGEINSYDIAVDVAGNRYITGRYQLTADFDPSPNTFNLTATYMDSQYSDDSGDVFFAKYGPNGNLLWAKTIGGPDSYYGYDEGISIHLDYNGDIILMGTLGSDFDFDPSEGQAILSSTGGPDSFVAKYDPNGNYIWAVAIHDYKYEAVQAVASDNLGNIYLAGTGIEVSYIAKYNSNGISLWKKIFSNTPDPGISALIITPANQIVLTGSFGGTVDFDPSTVTANLTAQTAEGSDGYIAKYDTDGNYLWVKDIGGSGAQVSPTALALGQNGEIHSIGLFAGTVDFNPSAAINTINGSGTQNYFIAKYDANGNYLWAKALLNVENIYTNEFKNIAIGSAGLIYVCGNFQNTVDFDPSPATANLTSAGEKDIYIAKYDPNGNYLWVKAISGPDNESIAAMTVDAGGNINCTGNFQKSVDFDPSAIVQGLTSVGTFDVFIAKYTADGTFVNAGSIGGYPTSNSSENENKIALAPNGTIYVAGTFAQTIDFDPSSLNADLTSQGSDKNIFIAKYNAAGKYLWAKALPGIQSETMSLTAVTVDQNSNVYIAGYFFGTIDFDPSNNTASLTSNDWSDIFIAKYDADGHYLWAKLLPKYDDTIGYNPIKSIAADNNGNIYISGYFEGALDFDPSPANAILTSVQFYDIYIAKYNSEGNYQWAKAIGGTWYDSANAMRVNSNGDIYITGPFSDTVDFDPSPAIANLEAGGLDAMYFAKYNTNGNFLWVKGIMGLDYAEFETITLDNNGQIYLSGKFVGSADFDPSPAIATHTSSGGVESFIVKYDANGNYLWVKPILGNSIPYINSIATDNAGNLIMVGDYGTNYGNPGTTVIFDPTNTATTFTTTGARDLFIAKYSSGGNYLWAKSTGGAMNETASSIVINSSDEMIITGAFSLNTDFDLSDDSFNLTSINSSDMFLAKYKDCSPTPVAVTISGNTLSTNTPADSYQWVDCSNHNAPISGATNASFTPAVSGNYAAVISINGCRSTSACQAVLSTDSALARSVKLYPNPSSGIFKIALPIAYEKTEVQVTDLTGKIIRKWNFNAQQEFEITLEEVTGGMYFIQLHCDEETATYKVIKN